MRKFPYTEILGWSASRYDVFMSCKRNYFYTYYSKHDKEFSKERINRLRSLTTIPMEAGSLAHELIAAVLHRLQKSSMPINRQRLFVFLSGIVEETVSKKEFFEVYYKRIDRVDMDQLVDIALKSILQFLDSDRFAWIVERAQNRSDAWIIEPEGFGETRIAGLKAYCKVDFMLPDRGKVYIFDWKSGKPEPEKHRKQVIGYALFANHNYGYDPKTIFPVLAYLKDNYHEEQIAIAENELSQFQQQVKTESEEMWAFTKDVNRNIPLNKEHFPLLSNPALCAYCNFKELCGRA
ncbi:MAG TPA: hypothetical protein DEP18_02685 [Flavobacteriales bacterium]|nr:hypothetical protein [Flavobacteriales bacterium]HRE75582.1 PD-(D/E)XK nuclease family protein [Flavobacteriales bacterium]HRE98513.1 PD-(D/E)XK nuclease family protein [Flavobacteriales bacterium]HRJ34415.1 PD-(D/E)XK nuclease family protein [Flavobacteriales bacterium]HRJ38665.1 PD-(D/E)XK nuclease family protein [Flavobacteriales bacterium]